MSDSQLSLIAANGLAVCVEEAGEDNLGIVNARTSPDHLGVWETLTRHDRGNGKVALSVTSDRDGITRYFSAQPDGSIACNRVTPDVDDPNIPDDLKHAVGAWEEADEVTLGDGQVAYHFWTGFLCADLGLPQNRLVANRSSVGAWETFTVKGSIVPPPWPTLDQRIHWAGNFCIPDALPGSPYGDGRRIWTPAYGCYDTYWRNLIRNEYRERQYTHFVYNCAGLPYGSDYPELADDPDRVLRDLFELLEDGLIPVVCATDDRAPDVVLDSYIQNADVIPVCFPQWEMNGVMNNDEMRMKTLIMRVKEATPGADCYLHFTPGHGSISYDEAGGWRWCQANGTMGLLAQGSNTFAAETPQTGGEGLESTAIRLAGLHPAWAGLNQRTVKFEYGIWDVYHGRVTEAALVNYGNQFLAYCPTVSGFCDGASRLVRV